MGMVLELFFGGFFWILFKERLCLELFFFYFWDVIDICLGKFVEVFIFRGCVSDFFKEFNLFFYFRLGVGYEDIGVLFRAILVLWGWRKK